MDWSTEVSHRAPRVIEEVFEPVPLVHEANHAFADSGGWGFLWGVLPSLLLLAVAGAAVWGLLRLTSPRMVRPPASPASGQGTGATLEELRLRYARGEMPREEFVQRAQDPANVAGDPAPDGG